MTVAYSAALPFFCDFFDSLRNQTYKHFDVLIINDGISEFPTHLLHGLHHTIIDYTSTPSKNREFGLNKAYELGYEHVILCDIDDFCNSNRIELSKKKLKNFDCVVNDLNIISKSGKIITEEYFSSGRKIPTEITLEYIIDKNLCGFSNTALNIKKIYPIVLPEEIKIVDWYFFTNLLIRGFSIGFEQQALTYYRQHDNNAIGITYKNIEGFKRMIKLKIQHYEYLLQSSSCQDFEKRLLDTKRLLSYNDEELNQIIKKNTINNPLWWENIKL